MLSKVIYPAIAVIFISIIVYYYLGGFNPVSFTTSVKDINIYGHSFHGKYDDDTLEVFFNDARKLALENENRQLVVVDYFMTSEDSVKQFIGVISKDSIHLPSLILKGVKMVQAVITVSPLVRPHPMTIREKAQSYAKSIHLTLDGFAIEIYKPNEEIEVWFPAKDN